MKIPYDGIAELIDSFQDILGQFGKVKNVGKSLQIKAWVKIDDINVRSYPALISQNRKMLYVPTLGTVWYYPKVQRFNGIEYVCCSARNARCLDWDRLEGIAAAQKYSAAASFRYMRKWATLEIKDMSGTFDMSIFDEKNGDMCFDFGQASASVVRAKTLTAVLDDLPQKEMMLYMGLAGFFGWGLGQLTSFVLYILYRWWLSGG